MSTLLGIKRDAVMADPLGAAQRAASLTGMVVVMKGSCTHIVDPDGQTSVCRHGNVGLATSGSGDTLAGIIVGLLARGASPLLAAQWAVFLHAEAGQRLKNKFGLLGFLAREIPLEIPAIMEEVISSRRPVSEHFSVWLQKKRQLFRKSRNSKNRCCARSDWHV